MDSFNFNWPKQPVLIFIEDILNKKEKNNNQKIDLHFQEEIDFNDVEEEEEDILFDYDRYSNNNIRKVVLEDLSKINDLNSKMDIDEEEFVTKDYDYYKCFGLFE